MRDLNQIDQQNHQAAEQEGYKAARAAGKFVVVEYAGLSYIGFTEHDTAAQAHAHALSITGDTHNPSARTEVLNPTGEPAKDIVAEHFDTATAAGGASHDPV